MTESVPFRLRLQHSPDRELSCSRSVISLAANFRAVACATRAPLRVVRLLVALPARLVQVPCDVLRFDVLVLVVGVSSMPFSGSGPALSFRMLDCGL